LILYESTAYMAELSNLGGKLFEPGYRGKTAQGTEGSGMGLNLARRLIELQGGTLTLSSRFEQGFTGTIRLPTSPPGDD
jgi:signal transduction histidine kinase